MELKCFTLNRLRLIPLLNILAFSLLLFHLFSILPPSLKTSPPSILFPPPGLLKSKSPFNLAKNFQCLILDQERWHKYKITILTKKIQTKSFCYNFIRLPKNKVARYWDFLLFINRWEGFLSKNIELSLYKFYFVGVNCYIIKKTKSLLTPWNRLLKRKSKLYKDFSLIYETKGSIFSNLKALIARKKE